ncbi:MAG: cobalamin-binding protein [Chlorobiaceae bacterium]|nr:cobalamin-binding protein [Chlorobiaceae bacterium]NTV60649.1 cobalamin-binding protein [Chlorobiaceae bacterium]
MPNIVPVRLFSFLLPAIIVLFLSGCNPGKSDNKFTRPSEKAGKPAVVSLAPSLTEMIYAIGAGEQLVGRTSACDWPREALHVPVAGAFGRPSLEVLASINPDLVIDVDLEEKNAGDKITSLGIRKETIQCRTPDDIPAALRRLGKLTGHVEKADSLALTIEKGLDEYRRNAATATSKKRVYLEIWDDPFWTGGKGSYTSSLIAYAGGENIGDAIAKEYFEISQEWVISQNPDIIACMYMSKYYSAKEKVRKRPGWTNIKAVRENRVYDNFDNNIFLRPGPRVLEGIRQLSELLHRQ